MSAALHALEPSSHRGAFAFHYAPALSDDGIAWYSQFDLLVTHDPLPRAQVERLHAAGTRLLLYEWSVAFYESRATAWQRSLLTHDALLNRDPLTGGAGADTAAAWYFDPMSREHQIDRAADLVKRIQDNGYDGVFLDTTTIESVHPAARSEYERRHPGTQYDVAFSRFLAELRKKLPHGVIFTNQGYRSPDNYLPYADADLTESLITRPQNGSFQLRPWNDPGDPWNSIFFLMRTVIEPLTKRYPNVRFSHLNYIGEASPQMIRVAFAVARLFGGDAYAAAPNVADEIDPIYFYDFGRPLSPRVDAEDGSETYRVFERGVIGIRTINGEPRAFFRTIDR